MGRNLSLIRLMILEEFRLNASMIGRAQFMMFPVLIAVFTLILSVASPIVLRTMPIHQVFFLFCAVMTVYGVGVGGFALFSETIAERRFGQVTLLLQTPTTHPIDFRTMFMVFYVKDIIYYMFFSVVPIAAGLLLSVPLTHYNITTILFLVFIGMMSFLTGISLSFFMSSLWVRSKTAFSVAMLTTIGLIASSVWLHLFSIRWLLPALQFFYTRSVLILGLDILMIVAFSAFAIAFIKVISGKRAERFNAEILLLLAQFKFAGQYSAFAAKEWVDIRRSRTLAPIMSAYVGPLVFLTILQWFLTNLLALPISFNVVFYAALLGFFSITIYSWLNITDTPDFYQVLPVSVPQIIKTKLILLSFFTYGIATAFLVFISILSGQLWLLPLALLVAFVNTTYTVLVTAYLTGLRTNSYMFDPSVLGRFALLIIPPLILMVISSFLLELDTNLFSLVIAIACVAQCLAILALPRAIENKWGKAGFTV